MGEGETQEGRGQKADSGKQKSGSNTHRSAHIFWMPAVALAGALAWWFSFRVARIELARVIGFGGRAARRVALELVAPAYLAGGIMTVTSALFGQLAAKWAQLEAAGGTFG